MKKDLIARVSMIRAMDKIVQHLNDEEKKTIWLAVGVPYDAIKENTADEELFWLVGDDEVFARALFWFIKIMNAVPLKGGITVDGINSGITEVDW